MASRSRTTGLDYLLRFLVAYRILFYLGGLLAMSIPLLAAWVFDVEVPTSLRTTVVAVSFGVILVTYFAERRVGLDHVDPRTGESVERYSRRMRVSVLLSIVGIAAGVYLLLERNPVAGLVFIAGAFLFFQIAYRSDRPEPDRGD